ncbi:MAG: hypothetical protein ACR5LG_16320 [Sodalis sp. (in: enterobacteria)]|uniref:hypothetical protein n=1 Tax=Sodalis sp. (in: enterobacteria) TaxID=1898979 RepID=UPI003F409C68
MSENISSRYSEVTVLAQGHGSAQADGRHYRRSQVKDKTVPLYRPLVAVVGDADSDEEVYFRARKLMADARLNGLLITAVVRGPRTATGQLWAPGQQYAEQALQPLLAPAALTSESAVRHKVTCGCISTSWPPTAICKPLLTR